jgi:hypothetical protein
MKFGRTVAALASFLLLLASLVLSAPANARSIGGGGENGPSKWFHHEKKNPNRKKVHHAKPAHHPKKQKPHSHR